MATLRAFLLESGFDYEHGKIIVGCLNPNDRWDEKQASLPQVVAWDNPMLDKEFDDGFGSAECPEYVAEDRLAIYFPSEYDGSTSPERVFKNIDVYFSGKVRFPYPGGG